MTPFDPKWPKMKFDTGNVFIRSNYINTLIIRIQAHMSHRKRIFKPKSRIWPQMTPFDIWPSKVSMRNSHMPNESIGVKKPQKNGHVCPSHCAQIWILQVDFLEILNISRIRNENFDKFFDPKEPEYNIFGPIPEHSKITVFLFIQSPQYKW